MKLEFNFDEPSKKRIELVLESYKEALEDLHKTVYGVSADTLSEELGYNMGDYSELIAQAIIDGKERIKEKLLKERERKN